MSFDSSPQYAELTQLARSGNSLLVLGIEARELSWTKFMAWAMCPERRGATLATQALVFFLKMAQSARGLTPNTQEAAASTAYPPAQDVISVIRARDEVDSGGRRLDVMVEFIVAGKPWSLLIENKIHASESRQQLAAYFEHWTSKQPQVRAVPVLVDIGDHPAPHASVSVAPVIGRANMEEWLAAIVAADKLAHVAQDYLALLRGWDAALELKQRHWAELEAASQGGRRPVDWSLVSRWLGVDGRYFYTEVRRNPVYAKAMADFGMRDSLMYSGKSQATGIQFRPPEWRLSGGPEWQGQGVEVHYEGVRRGELFVHVELSPYIGSLDSNRRIGERRRFAEQLAVKKEILVTLRDLLQTECGSRSDYSVNVKRLKRADKHSTLAAVRFVGPEAASVDPSACAQLIACVVRDSSPLITQTLRDVARRHFT